MTPERRLAVADEIGVFALDGIEPRMRRRRYLRDTHDGDVGRQHKVELVDYACGIGDGRRRVEVRHVIGCVDAGVGAAGTGNGDRFAQQRCQRSLDGMLDGRGIALALPAAVCPAVVLQFDEISHPRIAVNREWRHP